MSDVRQSPVLLLKKLWDYRRRRRNRWQFGSSAAGNKNSYQPSRAMNPPLESQTSFLEDETVKVTSEGQAANLQKDWIYNQGTDTMGGKIRGQESTGWAAKRTPPRPPAEYCQRTALRRPLAGGQEQRCGLSPMWRKQDPIQRAGHGALLSTVMWTY